MTAITHTNLISFDPTADFGRRKGSGLVILHTVENSDPAKITVRDALAVARWQSSQSVLGSYNILIGIDGAVLTIPWDHISGGVNPGGGYFDPVDWLYQLLPAYKVNDPNAYGLNISFMGRRAHFDAYGWPPAMIDRAARLIIEEEKRIGGEVVVANHAHFQPGNRTDAGKALGLVMARYDALTAAPPKEEENPIMTPTDISILPEGSTAAFAGGKTYDLFMFSAAGDIVKMKWTPPKNTRAGAVGYFVFNNDTAHPSILLHRSYINGSWRRNAFVSGWGIQPDITVPEVVVPTPEPEPIKPTVLTAGIYEVK